MTDLHLTRKRLEPGNIQGYSRNGFDLATAPIPEYITLFSSLLADNKTAVWELPFDFIPCYLTAKYTGTTGAVTLTIKQKGVVIWTQTCNRSERVNSYGGNREGGVVPLRLALTASVINSKTSRF